jgi:hypothetical protein
MTQKETGAADVTLDLLAIQSSALEAIRDYTRYLRNAENAELPEVVHFLHLLMEEDSARAAHCQGLLRKLGSTGTGRPASQPAEHTNYATPANSTTRRNAGSTKPGAPGTRP